MQSTRSIHSHIVLLNYFKNSEVDRESHDSFDRLSSIY